MRFPVHCKSKLKHREKKKKKKEKVSGWNLNLGTHSRQGDLNQQAKWFLLCTGVYKKAYAIT